MKKQTHPDYQDVLFVDTATNKKIVIGSTLKCEETMEFEGVTYPVCYVAVSSASHPFYTGDQKFVDTEGRIDKFKNRYKRTKKSKPQTDADE